ncbi:TPA: excinuclease ABC subunit C [candidate division WOR-3 bacterium]|jgi:excinuclease ABC subunit C|uniref:Excinuclease ABC subunit C n=1 Tax=candidate division WOR-3 bacterium TaxID=2052148 RepID=A0A350HAD6_UNCW3|nr:excinuclease ABC subunit C [candidate division WOR-3 bacterium]
MIDFESIPDKTGIYIFRDKDNKIIYIGKANSIKQRVKQYFIGNQDTRPQIEFIRRETETIDFSITDSESQALLLEYNLIKKHKPKYNVKLKDSSKYPYIMISNEDYPYLSTAYDIDGKGIFFGPFTSGLYVKTLVESLNRIYRLRSCKKILPKKTCIEYQMLKCAGVCAVEEEQRVYKEKIQKIKNILNGGTRGILAAMSDEMNTSAKNEDFERAVVIRDTISFVRKEMRKGKKTGIKDKNKDVFSFVREKNSGAFSILKLRNGTIHEIFTKRFSANVIIDDQTVIGEILSEYYVTTTDFDFDVLVINTSDEDFIKKEIFQNKKITVKRVQEKTSDYQLYETAYENACTALYFSLNRKFIAKSVLQLQKDLLLEKIPENILGLDISHVNGEWTSGAVVSFKNGKPMKSMYRYYNLEKIGNNDYLALSTILKRYLEKYQADMIIIDGGLGQLSSCMKIVKELNKEIAVFALAKRFDILYDSRGNEIMLNGRTSGAALIKAVRDESHRFANKLRKIKMEKIKTNGRKSKNIAED